MSPDFFLNKKQPGFRVNGADISFLSIMLVIFGVCHYLEMPFAISIMPFMISFFFFLFCNVCRIGKTLEIAWMILAVPYLLIGTIYDFGFVTMYAEPAIIAITVIGVAIYMGWYRGFLWRDIAIKVGRPVKKVAECQLATSQYRDLGWVKTLIAKYK